ncbi:ankyrin repeat domain-containing protein [Ferrimonas marina]|uniref:Ankyrin repeat-containing protein n=1 Tax=Ferrimonas marina TaxID=299255 RepID=A0A1M5VEJ0_9GAMM|nr:ankyrin repeat domain-containing protein [Ferrimonas marina]SHH73585.1 Ankyrin repeat-containing protein [Ferrimonas marina]
MRWPRLHQAVLEGDRAALALALSEGASVFELEPGMGNSALHLAVQRGDTELVSLLLEAGAPVNLQTPTHGVTPLMVAVWHRQPAVVAQLLAHPQINPQLVSHFGLTALGLTEFGAADSDPFGQQQSEQMAQLLAQYGHDRAQWEASQPLFLVITNPGLSEAQKRDKVTTLLANGAEVNACWPVDGSGNDGHTPLLIAAREGMASVVRALLEGGADQTLADHYMAAVPLHKAAYMGHAEVIELLAHFPGFHRVKDLQGPNNGYTPLHDAVWHGHRQAVLALLTHGVRTDLTGYDGQTPAQMAQALGYLEILSLLQSQ